MLIPSLSRVSCVEPSLLLNSNPPPTVGSTLVNCLNAYSIGAGGKVALFSYARSSSISFSVWDFGGTRTASALSSCAAAL